MPFKEIRKALFDYNAARSDELSFAENEILFIINNNSSGTGNDNNNEEWLKAKVRRSIENQVLQFEGLVPSNYIDKAEPLLSAVAMYDFEGRDIDELTIACDDKLYIYSKEDPDWWIAAHVHEQREYGIVPSNYLEIIAKESMNNVAENEKQTPEQMTVAEEANPFVSTAVPAEKLKNIISLPIISNEDMEAIKPSTFTGPVLIATILKDYDALDATEISVKAGEKLAVITENSNQETAANWIYLKPIARVGASGRVPRVIVQVDEPLSSKKSVKIEKKETKKSLKNNVSKPKISGPINTTPMASIVTAPAAVSIPKIQVNNNSPFFSNRNDEIEPLESSLTRPDKIDEVISLKEVPPPIISKKPALKIESLRNYTNSPLSSSDNEDTTNVSSFRRSPSNSQIPEGFQKPKSIPPPPKSKPPPLPQSKSSAAFQTTDQTSVSDDNHNTKEISTKKSSNYDSTENLKFNSLNLNGGQVNQRNFEVSEKEIIPPRPSRPETSFIVNQPLNEPDVLKTNNLPKYPLNNNVNKFSYTNNSSNSNGYNQITPDLNNSENFAKKESPNMRSSNEQLNYNAPKLPPRIDQIPSLVITNSHQTLHNYNSNNNHNNNIIESQHKSFQPPIPKPKQENIRLWKDKSGSYTVEAECISCNGGSVTLFKTNGSKVSVPLNMLCASDVDYITQQYNLNFVYNTHNWFLFFVACGVSSEVAAEFAPKFVNKCLDASFVPSLNAEILTSAGFAPIDSAKICKYVLSLKDQPKSSTNYHNRPPVPTSSAFSVTSSLSYNNHHMQPQAQLYYHNNIDNNTNIPYSSFPTTAVNNNLIHSQSQPLNANRQFYPSNYYSNATNDTSQIYPNSYQQIPPQQQQQQQQFNQVGYKPNTILTPTFASSNSLSSTSYLNNSNNGNSNDRYSVLKEFDPNAPSTVFHNSRSSTRNNYNGNFPQR